MCFLAPLPPLGTRLPRSAGRSTRRGCRLCGLRAWRGRPRPLAQARWALGHPAALGRAAASAAGAVRKQPQGLPRARSQVDVMRSCLGRAIMTLPLVHVLGSSCVQGLHLQRVLHSSASDRRRLPVPTLLLAMRSLPPRAGCAQTVTCLYVPQLASPRPRLMGVVTTSRRFDGARLRVCVTAPPGWFGTQGAELTPQARPGTLL